MIRNNINAHCYYNSWSKTWTVQVYHPLLLQDVSVSRGFRAKPTAKQIRKAIKKARLSTRKALDDHKGMIEIAISLSAKYSIRDNGIWSKGECLSEFRARIEAKGGMDWDRWIEGGPP